MMSPSMLLMFLAIIFSCITSVRPRSSGAPSEVCSSLIPGGPHPMQADDLPGGFYIFSDLVDNGGAYTPGTTYTVTLGSLNDREFLGFVVQARESGTSTLIGSFDTPSGTQHLTCSGVEEATVTHTSSSTKTSLMFQWTAPSGSSGTVEFRYTIVTGVSDNYYANLNAADNRPPEPSSTTGATVNPTGTTSIPDTANTAGTTDTPGTTSIASTAGTNSIASTAGTSSIASIASTTDTVVIPTMSPTISPVTTAAPCEFDSGFSDDYSFSYGVQGESDYYIASRVNPYNSEYLEIALEGVGDGWVALGLSLDKSMGADDVFGCRVSTNGSVVAIDSWNVLSPPRNRSNILDDSLDDICIHSGNFTDGRITCRFSRRIIGSNPGQDYNLTEAYYLLFGTRNESQPDTVLNFDMHGLDEGRPSISDNLVSIICPSGPGPDDNYTVEYTREEGEIQLRTRVNPYNPYYLDIALEGEASGWIALGLSRNNLMDSDDVMGCRADLATVTAIDTWNPSIRHTPNVPDTNQFDICLHSGSFEQGRISCVFSRLINGTGSGPDYNLNDTYYLILGRRVTAQQSSMNFPYHTDNGGDTPSVLERTNIVTGSSSAHQLTASATFIAVQLLILLAIGAKNIL